MDIRFLNIFASLLITTLAYYYYMHFPYYTHYFNVTHAIEFFAWNASFTTFEVFKYTFYIYIVSFTIIYMVEKNPAISKSVQCFYGMARILYAPIEAFEQGIPQSEKIAILSVAVKVFFVPLMLSWLFGHLSNMLTNLSYCILHYNEFSTFVVFFQEKFYTLCFQLILFFDVFFFTISYLVEHRSLGNQIISVEPTVLGWLVAIICYPPFNDAMNVLFPWVSSDFPFFSNPLWYVGINILLLSFLTIYTWASLALNFKASNLTHRGIISHGPYRYIRHPAYVCKNVAWWLGTLPTLIAAIPKGFFAVITVFLCMATWSIIYFLRALTEERHLRMVNPEYEDYMEKVPYRFIPGIL